MVKQLAELSYYDGFINRSSADSEDIEESLEVEKWIA